MGNFREEFHERALALLRLYPEPRSATIPLCHLAQEQDGYLTEAAMTEIATLTSTTPAEVLGTASFYDMLHTKPVGKYLVGVCTNIACLLQGGEELLENAAEVFGVAPGETSEDGNFTLEEVECIALCDRAPCAIVNYRFFGPLDGAGLEDLRRDLLEGVLADVVPRHGVLNRVFRRAPELIPFEEIDAERAVQDAARAQRKDGGASV